MKHRDVRINETIEMKRHNHIDLKVGMGLQIWKMNGIVGIVELVVSWVQLNQFLSNL